MADVVHTREFDAVFVTATDTAHTPADKVAGVKDLSSNSSRAMTDTTYQGDDVVTNKPGPRTIAFTCSGHVIKGDAVQKALRDAHEDGSIVYVSIVEDEEAVLPASKGKRYACYVESFNSGRAQGDVVTFDAAFSLGSPVIADIPGEAA